MLLKHNDLFCNSIFVTLDITVVIKNRSIHISCPISLSNTICHVVPICIYLYIWMPGHLWRPEKSYNQGSCHRSTMSGLESSLSQDTKGPEQLLDSPTRLLGLPVVAGLGCAVENLGDVAWVLPDSGSMRTWGPLLAPLRSGDASASSAPRISEREILHNQEHLLRWARKSKI